MWTTEFWKAATERMVRGGAAALMSVWVVGDAMLNAFSVNWSEAGGIFLGGMATSLVMSLAGHTVFPGEGPSFSNVEKVE